MAEDIKEKIYNFLAENKNNEFNVKQISKKLGISYPTVLKWVDVLNAEGLISVADYGNVKIVRIKNERK